MSLKIILVYGPTAVGKTDFALSLALQQEGEILCMDAFQIYHSMPILTASPSPEQILLVPHHLFQFLSPLQNFSAIDWYYRAVAGIQEIWSRGKTPVLVGGTGLYARLLQQGIEDPGQGEDRDLRKSLEAQAMEKGSAFLHEELRQVDPVRASQLHPNDQKRIIRALERVRLGGNQQRQDLLAKFCPLWVSYGLTMERDRLYTRVEERVDLMVQAGLISEVQNLLDLGVSDQNTAFQAIGLKETVTFLKGRISHQEWLALLKQSTRRLAKRQWTWLRALSADHSIEL